VNHRRGADGLQRGATAAAHPVRPAAAEDRAAAWRALTGPADFAAQARSLTQQAATILDAAFARTGAQLLVSLDNLHSPYYATAGYPAVTVPLGTRVARRHARPDGRHGDPACRWASR
jgi:hypothetical protein